MKSLSTYLKKKKCKYYYRTHYTKGILGIIVKTNKESKGKMELDVVSGSLLKRYKKEHG